eukprot:TRINITY_DN17091_c0_g1_i2.p2 TRINITY_DN17091_c0_g1~~TRINITY_DN17091_c0_g1_i2.p2  ORF type:complete len:198 (+),score=54.36 TRINITY_DN17091_c0_g1_i2:131-724(+)
MTGVFYMQPIREWLVEWYYGLRDSMANTRQFILSAISLGMVVFSALMIWRGLTVVTCSESPIVVVLSGSMRPGMDRGDLLFLTLHDDEPYKVGDIVVFKVEGRDVPIVHRVIESHIRDDDRYGDNIKLLTKGDANGVNDLSLYTPGQLWVERRHILGRAKGFLPYVGFVTILMNEYPYLKYGLLGTLALFALTNRDE